MRASGPESLRSLRGHSAGARHFERYLLQGGLPGICFYREAHVRDSHFAAHLDTLLNRDLRQVYPTTLLADSLKALLRHMATTQGQPFAIGEASRISQISRVTLKRVLFALEALFLIRVIPCEGLGRPTIFLEDQGMATWLSGKALESADDVVRGLYANLRQEFHYRPALQGRLFQWRTRNGAVVPLAFASRNGTLGIVATLSREPAAKTLGNAQGFLRKFPRSRVIVAYGGDDIIFKTPSMIWVPYWLLC
jgi:predicted AAA+ superfamily ATPase